MTQATDIRHKTYYGLGTQIDLTLFGVADDQLLDEANASSRATKMHWPLIVVNPN